MLLIYILLSVSQLYTLVSTQEYGQLVHIIEFEPAKLELGN